MSPVAIVTDTTHYAPRALIEDAGIHEVSLYVNEAGSQQREADMSDFSGFYERLQSSAELPTTSQPSIGDFLEVFRPLAQEGFDIASVHISKALSGTHESARQAAAELMGEFPERRVEVFDSRLGCGVLAYIVLAGAAAAKAGGDIEHVRRRLDEAIEAGRLWFAVDTLEFLRRGGRIGAAQAWVGGALKIKPILTCDGEISPVERVRTSGRALERMIEFMRAQQADGADAWVVQHVQAPDQAERLVEAGREIFGCDPMIVSEIGPVIGVHVGPGLLGVGGGPAALLT